MNLPKRPTPLRARRSPSRWRAAALLACGFGALAGCSALTSVFQPAELSENYATLPGVTAEYAWEDQAMEAPGLVDGSAAPTVQTSREVRVRLPEARAIRRVVARNANYENATLYTGGRGADEWRMAGQTRKNTETDITFRVNAFTDRIRIRIGNTHDDRHGAVARVINAAEGTTRTTTFAPGQPRAGEIEIYGYRPKTEGP